MKKPTPAQPDYWPEEPMMKADRVAGLMRDFYEANKPLRWWQKRRVWNDIRADDLMLELLWIVRREYSI